VSDVRLLDRVLAPLLALLVAAAAVVLAVEVVAVAVGTGPIWVDWTSAYQQGAERSWQDGTVRLLCAGLLVLGLALLLAELKPRRPARLPLRTTLADLDAAVSRHGLASTARTAAMQVDGVGSTSVRVRRRSVRIAARARYRDAERARALRDPIHQAVATRLERLELARPVKVRVRVTSRRS
jgi:hypothetical protein